MNNNTKIKKKKRKSGDRTWFILFATIPPLINFLIFYVYINASAFFRAFFDSEGNPSLLNFVKIVNEFQKETSDLSIALKNTLLTFAIILISYPFKVLVSYFIYKKVPFYNFYRVVFFLPMIIFSVCINLSFQRMIGPSGPIAQFVSDWMNLDYVPELLADSRFANTVVILHMLWLGFPGDLIIWGGTFARIPDEVLESGRIDGTTWWTEFTKITIPLVWPTLTLQMVMMFAALFSSSGAVFLLTGGNYGTQTLASWLYIYLLNNSRSFGGENTYNFLSAVGLVITALAVTISMTVRKISSKFNNDIEF